MSRGVVLWPDEWAAAVVRDLWNVLSDHGLPSLATHAHRLHQPHCSLIVAEELPVDEALEVVDVVPSQRIPLLVGSVGVFPSNGALFLACVANQPLLSEQRRVHRAVTPLTVQPWPYFEFNAWVPLRRPEGGGHRTGRPPRRHRVPVALADRGVRPPRGVPPVGVPLGGPLARLALRAISRVATEDTEADLVSLALHTTASDLERIVARVPDSTPDDAEGSALPWKATFFEDGDGNEVLLAKLPPDWDSTVLGRWEPADAVEGLVRRGAGRWN